MAKINLSMEKKSIREIGFQLASGAAQVAWWWLFVVVMAVALNAAVQNYMGWNYDATDPASHSHRSGLSIKTDCGTGVQYLVSANGGLTPRLDVTGHVVRDVATCK